MRGKRNGDLTGREFGRLIVIGRHPEQLGRDVRWIVQCSCGTVTAARTGNLLRKHGNKSCGCLKRERATTHGQSRTPAHRSWDHMIGRCTRIEDERYQDYGGRGIAVCERWLEFANFLADMGPRPAGTTLDRIDVNGNYEPGNCRWATKEQQATNTRRNVWLVVDGERMILRDAAAKYGISASAVGMRLKYGWPLKRALTQPIQKRTRKAAK